MTCMRLQCVQYDIATALEEDMSVDTQYSGFERVHFGPTLESTQPGSNAFIMRVLAAASLPTSIRSVF